MNTLFSRLTTENSPYLVEAVKDLKARIETLEGVELMNIKAQDIVNELARQFPKELEIVTQALIIRELESNQNNHVEEVS